MNYADLNDESLVLLTLSGNTDAYGRLVQRHEKAVIRAAAAVTHNEYLAEDATQDAFVTAWIKLNVLREPSNYRSWVCRISQNCAKRMMEQYRTYIDYEELADYLPDPGTEANPEYALEKKEEKRAVAEGIERLPGRVKTIIRLYYIDGKPISEIAELLGISVGSVKTQLFDGRKRLRKDLGAMDETKNDTLSERVMKKVEELKKWQYKTEKNGFETEYRAVLSEVEALPESTDKQSALADVLMRGWWWIPGEQNDALFARIREAAIAGKNEEVMSFIVTRESQKMWGDERGRWLSETAIPELIKNGFSEAVGRAWLSVTRNLTDDFRTRREEMLSACEKALGYLPADSANAYLAKNLRKALSLSDKYADIPELRFQIGASVTELRLENGEPMYWDEPAAEIGKTEALEWEAGAIIHNAARLDGRMMPPDLRPGENCREKLYFTDEHASVDTPAGFFENCRVYAYREDFTEIVTYYRENVGIVRQDFVRDGYTTVYLLSSYSVKGTGYFPCAVGNTWCYVMKNDASSLSSEIVYTVENCSADRILISGIWESVRPEYSDDCWEDMVQAIANEYWTYQDGKEIYGDVSHYIERAEQLAATPMQKAHTAAASSVAKRIMETSEELTKGSSLVNLWNFFDRSMIRKKGGKLIKSSYNSRWSFELKSGDGSQQFYILLRNFIYDILFDNGHALWDDAWTDGYSETIRKPYYTNEIITSEISCSACGETSVPAGTFADCMKVRIRTIGYPDGVEYRNGVQEYIFARGVGLISAVSEITESSGFAAYLLTKYEGIGDGYMPFGDGFFRRYEAQGLTDGYVGYTEYTTVRAGEDSYVLFSDQCGVRKKPEGITLYSSVAGEIEEQKLYAGDHVQEAQQKGKLVDLKLLFHFIFRFRNLHGDGGFAASYMMMAADAMKALGGGTVPDALLGAYARRMLSVGAACMSCGRFETGFACLDESFAAYRKWETFPKDALLSVGVDPVYSDIRMVKGKPILVLPDGTREPIPDADEMTLCGDSKTLPYYGMTHPDGWAWFRPVIDHPVYGKRFEEYKELAKKLAEE